jgi:hypothetical protein
VAQNEGYRVLTTEGKTVGRVAGESEAAYVVECGSWPRKSLRTLPRRFASVDAESSALVMQVSKEIFTSSPKLSPGSPVDDQAVASWWGLD